MTILRDKSYETNVVLGRDVNDLKRRVDGLLKGRSWINQRLVSVSHHTDGAFSSAIVVIANLEKDYS